MKPYSQMSREELLQEKEALEQQYKEICAKGLKLDMSRGKPSKAQLDLSQPMMDVLHADTVLESRMGTDLRNYGVLDGIDEAKELIAGMIDTKPENVIVYGNASLNIMYDTVSRSMVHGVLGHTPWRSWSAKIPPSRESGVCRNIPTPPEHPTPMRRCGVSPI